MTDFLDTFALNNLSELRNATLSGTAENNATIVPGVYLSWDDENTGVKIGYDSPEWAALSLDYTLSAPPRWLSLNLALAGGRFEAGDVIVLVVEGYAEKSASIGLQLRSDIEGEIYDCDWDDTIELHSENDVAVALRTLEVVDGVVGRDGYHTLILSLPTEDRTLTLRNLRLFRMPGSRGLRSTSETLSSMAV